MTVDEPAARPIDVRAELQNGAAVGYVGIGRMGEPMMAATAEAGFPVMYSDVRGEIELGFPAGFCNSPASLAERCPIVSVIVGTDDQVLDAITGPDGVLAGARPGTVVLVHSTIHRSTLDEIAEAGHAVGVEVLDAAVSGRYGHVSVGDLCVLVGGDRSAFEVAEPVMSTYGGMVVHLGPLGAGLDVKLALNLIRYHVLLATGEASGLLAAAGLDVPFWEIVAHSGSMVPPHAAPAADRPLVARLAENRRADAAEHDARTARKDLRAAIERAAEVGLTLPSTGRAIDVVHTIWGLEDAPG